MILKAAAITCGLNASLILWNALVSNGQKSRIEESRKSILQLEKSIDALGSKCEKQAADFRKENEELKREIKMNNQLFERLFDFPNTGSVLNPFIKEDFL
jgi:hypothetical protein